MDTVQALRRRAQLNGSLQSNDQYIVQQQGQDIAVYPAQPQVVYVPYYDPYVVYGTWNTGCTTCRWRQSTERETKTVETNTAGRGCHGRQNTGRYAGHHHAPYTT